MDRWACGCRYPSVPPAAPRDDPPRLRRPTATALPTPAALLRALRFRRGLGLRRGLVARAFDDGLDLDFGLHLASHRDHGERRLEVGAHGEAVLARHDRRALDLAVLDLRVVQRGLARLDRDRALDGDL